MLPNIPCRLACEHCTGAVAALQAELQPSAAIPAAISTVELTKVHAELPTAVQKDGEHDAEVSQLVVIGARVAAEERASKTNNIRIAATICLDAGRRNRKVIIDVEVHLLISMSKLNSLCWCTFWYPDFYTKFWGFGV